VLGGLGFVMAVIYRDPRLTALVCALSLAPILRGLTSPRMVSFIQKMDFRRDAGIEVAGKAVALVVSSVLAFGTHSYWAIASATIATPLVMCALSYWFAPYAPRVALSEWQLFKNLVGWNTLSQLFASMNWQADRLLLGYTVPETELGRYAMAGNLAGIPIQAVVVPMGNSLLSAFAARRDDGGSVLASTYLKSSNAILAIGGPIFMGLALLAVPAVRLVLGPGWNEAGHYLQWLALISIIALPTYHIGNLALALDQARMVAWRTIGEFIVAMPALLIGSVYFGIPGVIAARALSVVVVLLISMHAVRILVGCSFAAQLVALRRTAAALAVLAFVVTALRPLVDMANPFVLTLSLGAVSLAGGVAYLVVLYALWARAGRPEGVEHVVAAKVLTLFNKIRCAGKTA
ncbi:MAG: oligosaccharide flippase family protein, partial [Alphaproteobacteria bacterium]|nr:oligosaccharide flippase family protein [Alphaproteobacteria bacterium]